MKRRPRAFGAACRPLNASVRLPIVVPHMEGTARMRSSMICPLRFRGPSVAGRSMTARGVQAISVIALSLPGAGCVSRLRSSGHQVPRSRASSGRQLRGLARSFVSVSSAVRVASVCRCLGSRVHSSLRSQSGSSLYIAVCARVRSAQELRQLSQSFTHGSLTTRSSGR